MPRYSGQSEPNLVTSAEMFSSCAPIASLAVRVDVQRPSMFSVPSAFFMMIGAGSGVALNPARSSQSLFMEVSSHPPSNSAMTSTVFPVSSAVNRTFICSLRWVRALTVINVGAGVLGFVRGGRARGLGWDEVGVMVSVVVFTSVSSSAPVSSTCKWEYLFLETLILN